MASPSRGKGLGFRSQRYCGVCFKGLDRVKFGIRLRNVQCGSQLQLRLHAACSAQAVKAGLAVGLRNVQCGLQFEIT